MNKETHEETIKCIREGKKAGFFTHPSEAIQSYCGLCSCGSPEPGNVLLATLLFCDSEQRSDFKKGSYSSTATELAAKVLDAESLVEHGSAIGWPWTTQEGKELLAVCKELWPEEMSDTEWWKEYFKEAA